MNGFDRKRRRPDAGWLLPDDAMFAQPREDGLVPAVLRPGETGTLEPLGPAPLLPSGVDALTALREKGLLEN